jgi:uncharacterized DUF497 family protein
MDFDWDRANIEHIALHSITPEEIEQVFANNPVEIDFATVNDEDRWTIIGHTNASRFFFVVFTMRGNLIRPVTAFEASKRFRDEFARAKRFY